MARLIVVVGLPGSGKSNYIRDKLQGACSGVCTQDFMAKSHGNSPRFTDSNYYGDLIRFLREGTDSVIADIEFCDTWRRVEVEEVIRRDAPGTVIDWRFFANDPDQCQRNIDRRGGPSAGEARHKVRGLSRKYFIPKGVEIIPVWAPAITNEM